MTEDKIREYLDGVMDGLIALEVVQESERQKWIDGILRLPSDMLHDFVEEQIVYMLLVYIGNVEYDFKENKWLPVANRIYCFDMEVGFGSIYTDTLMNLRVCTNEEIDISNVEEDFSHAEKDEIVGIDFCINGKQYHYDAKYQYDWFDPNLFLYIGSILAQTESDKYLYFCSDGTQMMIVLYETPEWIKKFSDVTGINPKKMVSSSM